MFTLFNQDRVTIFTDGACSGNPGPGGWGAVLCYKDKKKEISGGMQTTTNNRMELVAVIEALNNLTRPCRVELHTDSRYVQKGVSEWVKKWKTQGWRRNNRRPVKNQDLWQLLDTATTRHYITWHWVRGHAGHPENEQADILARAAGREQTRAASKRESNLPTLGRHKYQTRIIKT